MSGIAGILTFDGSPPEVDRIDAMKRQIGHRGPDGLSHETFGPCAMAHARFSIIDLMSEQQPLSRVQSHEDPSRGVHCVFNGEIYNHRALRKKLEKRGHRFQSDHSDTEVLLLGYQQWGHSLPKHLQGMFAFAIFDQAKGELMLVRDRIGEKPLYVGVRDREAIFGSNAATVSVGYGRANRPGLNHEALLDYLRVGYTRESTLLEGIEELPPASLMTITTSGRVMIEKYWRPPPVSKTSTSMGAVEALDEVLTESVDRRLESDVALGSFLSGGIDSAVIAAMASKSMQKRGQTLTTMSISIDDLGFTNEPYGKQVSQAIGSDHLPLNATADDAINTLTYLVQQSGEAIPDPALLPTYWACGAAMEHVRAVLSGAGADEVFGGLLRYRMIRQIGPNRWWLSKMPLPFPNAIPDTKPWRIRRRVEAAQAGPLVSQQYHHLVHFFTDSMIGQLCPGMFATLSEYGAHPAYQWPPIADPAHAAMRWDLHNVLPYHMLRRVDRASMSHPLEVRCPVFDTSVIELATHLPARVLMPGGKRRGLLRAVAANHLPIALVDASRKTYRLPVGQWLRRSLGDAAKEHYKNGVLSNIGMQQREIDRMFDEHREGKANHTLRLLALLSLSLLLQWMQRSEYVD